MKTQNIWVPIIIHFLNNNMMVVFSGTYSADVLQNQQIHWGAIPVALVMNLLIYGWVIFLKSFKEKKSIILNSFNYLEQFAGVPAFLGIVILISCIADWMIFAKIEVA